MVSPDENLENLKKICAKMHQNVLYMSFFNTHLISHEDMIEICLS